MSSVVDPYHFGAESVFYLMHIRIRILFDSDPDPDPTFHHDVDPDTDPDAIFQKKA